MKRPPSKKAAKRVPPRGQPSPYSGGAAEQPTPAGSNIGKPLKIVRWDDHPAVPEAAKKARKGQEGHLKRRSLTKGW